MVSRARFPAPSLRLSPEIVALGRRALAWLCVLHLVAQLGYSLPMELARTDEGRDMDIYYRAAVRLRDGQNLYQPWPEYGVQMTPGRFFYSPAFLLLTRPLAGLSLHDFQRVWLLLMFAAFWVFAACLGRLAAGRWDFRATLLWGAVADVVFLGHNVLSIGQFEPFMWMLFGLALTTKNRAGWLALATLVKIHPLWSLCLALSQDKRAWKSALLFALPVLAASWWLVGAHNWAMWWPATQPVASQGTFNPFNCSLPFFGLRLLSWGGVLRASGTLPAWAKLWLSGCAVGGPLVAAFWARGRSPELRLSLVACAGVLCAPLCWTAYLPLLLFPLAIWQGEKTTQPA